MNWRRIRAVVAFVLFLALAAPIEFNLAWYYGEKDKALIAGVLYFFAIIVAVEALMTLETHTEIANRPPVFLLKIALLIPVALFFLEFFPKRFGTALTSENPPCWDVGIGTWGHQRGAALFAGLLAVITHTIVDRANESLKQIKEN